MKFKYLFLLFIGYVSQSYAQISSTLWEYKSENKYSLDVRDINHPTTGSMKAILPNLSGELDTYILHPTKVVADEVADFYTIQTYQGYKENDKSQLIALSSSKDYFFAEIFGGKDSYSIETDHISSLEDKVDVTLKRHGDYEKGVSCSNTAELMAPDFENITDRMSVSTAGKETYRLALSASGEYSVQFGGSPYNSTNVLNALAAGVNSLNVLYERDLGVEFILVSNQQTIYPNAATDPFDPSDQIAMINSHQSVIDNAYGVNSYDVGHLVMWANTGGVAYVGVICSDTYKARGFSGNNITEKRLWIDYVAHEIGHQFGSQHNFVSQECQTSSGNHRYEVGEGSSIMSYAGLCGSGYVGESDPYFHYGSLEQIFNVINTRNCVTPTIGSNANNPVADAKIDITIPKQTPFILVGNVTDADGDNITYQWEQYDGDGSSVSGSPDCSVSNTPLFHFRNPVNDKFRCFPQHSEVLSGNNNGVQWEKLPCVARTMNFSLLGRDNNSDYGRIGEDRAVVTVADTGPFTVTSFNNGGTYAGATNQTITWDVNGTNAHCPNVDVLISTDGGSNYTEIADNVSNDGSQEVTFPNVDSSNAVILVRCHIDESLIDARESSRASDDFRVVSTFYDTGDAVFTINRDPLTPIELGQFTANYNAQTNRVDLSWFTYSEGNNWGFEVQKQINGNWQKIGFVNGNGTTFIQSDYSAVDVQPVQGQNLYRLKQIDFDGQSAYSKIIKVDIDLIEKVLVYDGYVERLMINKNCEGGVLNVYSTDGRQVKQLVVSSHQVDLSHLTRGFYIAIYYCEDEIHTLKIIK